MNKIVASVGLVALGASAVSVSAFPGLDPDSPKPWSISASLRGFYDDNQNTLPDSKFSSFGYEVSPSIRLAFPWEQTQLTLAYLFSAKYYDHRPIGNTDKFDFTHTFNGMLDHAFSERYHLNVQDSFVVGQEPDFLRAGNSFATFQRISGQNIRNYGAVAFNGKITPLLGFKVSYANAWYDYSDEGDSGIVPGLKGDPANPSASGTLDRLEHTIGLDSLWTIRPETIGVFGYQFRQVNYTGDEIIGETLNPVTEEVNNVMSKDRDYREHYAYVGVDHTFFPELTGSARIGGRYIDYYNDPSGSGNGWGPYASLSLRYVYAPESYAELGLTQDINSTDIVGTPGGQNPTARSFTSSSESTVVYASINHRITPRLKGSILGQFQNSVFSGGAFDSQSERYFLVGLNFAYQFTRYLAGEAGYNYDKLDSDVANRSFDRNRVYIGVTASY